MLDNNNPFLFEFRMNADSDEWGTTMSWMFAICDYLTDGNVEVPREWEFRQSPFGSDTEAYEYQIIDEIFIHSDDDDKTQTLIHAGDILVRYAHLLKSLGKDY